MYPLRVAAPDMSRGGGEASPIGLRLGLLESVHVEGQKDGSTTCIPAGRKCGAVAEEGTSARARTPAAHDTPPARRQRLNRLRQAGTPRLSSRRGVARTADAADFGRRSTRWTSRLISAVGVDAVGDNDHQLELVFGQVPAFLGRGRTLLEPLLHLLHLGSSMGVPWVVLARSRGCAHRVRARERDRSRRRPWSTSRQSDEELHYHHPLSLPLMSSGTRIETRGALPVSPSSALSPSLAESILWPLQLDGNNGRSRLSRTYSTALLSFWKLLAVQASPVARSDSDGNRESRRYGRNIRLVRKW